MDFLQTNISRTQLPKRVTSVLGAVLMMAMHMPDQAAERALQPRVALIGFAGPLADPMVGSARLGAELAIEEANRYGSKVVSKQSPLRFELLLQDDKSNPYLAGYIARYFIHAKVVGVLGHWNSGPAMAAAPAYEKAGIAQINITPTSRTLSRQGFRSYFRVVGSTDDTAGYLAESAIGALGTKRVAVIHNNTPFSIALAASFSRELSARAIPVMRLNAISAHTSDFNAPLKAAIDSGADLIFFSAITGQLQPFLDSALRMGVTTRILLTGGATSQKPGNAGRVYALEPGVPPDHCVQQRSFWQRYTARYGTNPTAFSGDAYDAAGLLIQAARKADAGDAAQVADVMHHMRYQGLGGEIRFDPDGNMRHPIYTLYQSTVRGWQSMQLMSKDSGSLRC